MRNQRALARVWNFREISRALSYVHEIYSFIYPRHLEADEYQIPK